MNFREETVSIIVTVGADRRMGIASCDWVGLDSNGYLEDSECKMGMRD
jgi:hypothetical protein